jgi:hypothetical protein
MRQGLKITLLGALAWGCGGSSTPSPPDATDSAEPGPADTADPSPADTAEPSPADTAEPGPADTAEPGPADTAEPGPADTAEPEEPADMSGSMTYTTSGRLGWEGPWEVFCDRTINFSGHAYIGACEACNFEFMLDTVEYESTGDRCTGSETIPGVYPGRYSSIIHADSLELLLPRYTYTMVLTDVLAFRWWTGTEYIYNLIDDRVSIETEGTVSWSGSDGYFDPWAWPSGYDSPTGFSRSMSLDMDYTLPHPESLIEEGPYSR